MMSISRPFAFRVVSIASTFLASHLTMDTWGANLEIISAHDVCDPAVGVHIYAAPTNVTCSVTNSPLALGGATRAVCTGWTGTGDAPVSGTTTNTGAFGLTNTSSITWNWTTQANISVTVTKGGGTIAPGSGWYTMGTSTTFVASSHPYCSFVSWAGDTNGCTINANQITVPNEGGRSIAATFTGGPWAYEVVDYTVGTNVALQYPTGIPYTNISSALGRPTRDGAWGDIAMFSPPYQDSEIVSIGSGGYLTIRFEHTVSNDVLNPFGADLIVFGNSFFFDAAYPSGQIAGLQNKPGSILVSQNGTDWHEITTMTAGGAYPSQGYRDTSSPYGDDGTAPSDFLRPVDTNLSWTGSDYATMLAGYDGAGGGAAVDIAETGLDWIQYVMVTQALGQTWSTEIDGFSDVAPVAAFSLTLQTNGSGSVNMPSGPYPHGTNLALQATPGTYYHFGEWSGRTQGDVTTNLMNVVMDRNRTITATFNPDLTAHDTPIHWLVENGLTNATYPTFAAAAEADLDHDGMATWKEFLAGTDADDEQSIFELIAHGRSDGSNYVQWIGGTNGSTLPFVVMGSSNLIPASWVELDGNVERNPSGTNTWWYENDTPHQFLRIEVQR